MNYERIVQWLIAAGVPVTVAAVVAAVIVAAGLLLGGCAVDIPRVVVAPEVKPSVSSSNSPASPPSPEVAPLSPTER